MRPIRVLVGVSRKDCDDIISRLRDEAGALRQLPGCLEFDFYRSVEFPENIVQAELWDTPEALDRRLRNWEASTLLSDVREVVSPLHGGPEDFPRRHGQNGVEFYRYQRFVRLGRVFMAEESADRIDGVRWPIHGGVRVVIQSCTDPKADDAFRSYSAETRSQPGCVEFDYFRSISFPENNLHLELWHGPPAVYDYHYRLRTLEVRWHIGVARPDDFPRDRQYGLDGLELYEHTWFTPVGTLWEPEEPADRLSTVRWV